MITSKCLSNNVGTFFIPHYNHKIKTYHTLHSIMIFSPSTAMKALIGNSSACNRSSLSVIHWLYFWNSFSASLRETAQLPCLFFRCFFKLLFKLLKKRFSFLALLFFSKSSFLVDTVTFLTQFSFSKLRFLESFFSNNCSLCRNFRFILLFCISFLEIIPLLCCVVAACEKKLILLFLPVGLPVLLTDSTTDLLSARIRCCWSLRSMARTTRFFSVLRSTICLLVPPLDSMLCARV